MRVCRALHWDCDFPEPLVITAGSFARAAFLWYSLQCEDCCINIQNISKRSIFLPLLQNSLLSVVLLSVVVLFVVIVVENFILTFLCQFGISA